MLVLGDTKQSCTCEVEDQSSPGQVGGLVRKQESELHSAGAVQRVRCAARRYLHKAELSL